MSGGFAVDRGWLAQALERGGAPRPGREVYDANALEQLDFDNEIDCCVLGDAAYKVTWDRRAPRASPAPDVQALRVALADDPARLWRVASRYTLSRRGGGDDRCRRRCAR
jgi:hypothetical protein